MIINEIIEGFELIEEYIGAINYMLSESKINIFPSESLTILERHLEKLHGIISILKERNNDKR